MINNELDICIHYGVQVNSWHIHYFSELFGLIEILVQIL